MSAFRAPTTSSLTAPIAELPDLRNQRTNARARQEKKHSPRPIEMASMRAVCRELHGLLDSRLQGIDRASVRQRNVHALLQSSGSQRSSLRALRSRRQELSEQRSQFREQCVQLLSLRSCSRNRRRSSWLRVCNRSTARVESEPRRGSNRCSLQAARAQSYRTLGRQHVRQCLQQDIGRDRTQQPVRLANREQGSANRQVEPQ